MIIDNTDLLLEYWRRAVRDSLPPWCQMKWSRYRMAPGGHRWSAGAGQSSGMGPVSLRSCDWLFDPGCLYQHRTLDYWSTVECRSPEMRQWAEIETSLRWLRLDWMWIGWKQMRFLVERRECWLEHWGLWRRWRLWTPQTERGEEQGGGHC